VTTCDETVTTETEKDQENTPENVSARLIFWTGNVTDITRILQAVINTNQQL
jgi:hypothetical protein